jgi:hypothetical protein
VVPRWPGLLSYGDRSWRLLWRCRGGEGDPEITGIQELHGGQRAHRSCSRAILATAGNEIGIGSSEVFLGTWRRYTVVWGGCGAAERRPDGEAERRLSRARGRRRWGSPADAATGSRVRGRGGSLLVGRRRCLGVRAQGRGSPGISDGRCATGKEERRRKTGRCRWGRPVRERERRGEGGRVGLKDRRGVGPGVARAGGKGRRVAGLRLVAELRGPRGKEEGKGCWASGGPCGR